jgi:uncharacterized membrane protein
MAEFLQTPEAQLVVWTAIFAGLLAIGFYVIAQVRRSIRGRESGPTAGEMMSEFRELHCQGELSDEEFRTIKSTLSERFQKELNHPGDSPAK